MNTRSRGEASAPLELVSFDGGVRVVQDVARPDRYRHIERLGPGSPWIPRGGGYSYSAASFGGGGTVQDLRSFDRVLEIDPVSCTVRIEAGASLGKLFSVAVRSGLYMPVQPGYPEITVGGCIAADVHGKNPTQDGTFRRTVLEVELFHPARGIFTAAPDQNRDIFELTCGGLGLTGAILSARLRLQRLPSRAMTVKRTFVPNFGETLALMDEAVEGSSIMYTWQDFTRGGGSFGRGFLYTGTFSGPAPGEGGTEGGKFVPVTPSSRGNMRVQLLNGFTTAAFNRVYGMAESAAPEEKSIGLWQALFPVSRKVLYFKLFGKAGFHEYQVIFPRSVFGDASRELERFFSGSSLPVTLASCKLFRGRQEYLRFDGDGVCLALDFPRDRHSGKTLAFLDALAGDLGGVPNLVKDSRLPAGTARRCFRKMDDFRSKLASYDPGRLCRSELSERLGL